MVARVSCIWHSYLNYGFHELGPEKKEVANVLEFRNLFYDFLNIFPIFNF